MQEAEQIHGSTLLEIVWTVIPLGISMVIFVWGAILYYHIENPPEERPGNLWRGQAMDVEVPASGWPA